MSSSNQRGYETDRYYIMTKDGGNIDSTEKDIINALNTPNITSHLDASFTTYNLTKDNVQTAWRYSALNNELIDTSSLSAYPSGIVKTHSAITITNEPPSDLNSYHTTIIDTSSNTYNFSMLSSSASFYNSTYKITPSIVQDCFDNTVTGTVTTNAPPNGASVKASFDMSNNNIAKQVPMQSRWNTIKGPYHGLDTVGDDPISLLQCTDYNTERAFGMAGTDSNGDVNNYHSKWLSSNADGSVEIHDFINSNFQPCVNNLSVAPRIDFSNCSLDNDIGIYRIQQPAPTISALIKLNDGSNNTITETQLNNIPLFDVNGVQTIVSNTAKSACKIPGALTDEGSFFSLFNDAVKDTIADQFSFNVTVENIESSGYNIDGSHNLVSNLDNSNLLDNPFYMQNYVSNDHSLSFSDASLNIIASTNGNGTSNSASHININLSQGEKLESTYAGVDGQIKVNPHISSSRITDASMNGLTTEVWYPGELPSDSSKFPISLEEMTTPYFSVIAQKIAQKTDTDTNFLKKDKKTILSLYSDVSNTSNINNSFNKDDFGFSFISDVSNNDIAIWKVNAVNTLLIESDAFCSDISYNVPIIGLTVNGTLSNTSSNMTKYTSYRNVLTAKTLDNIGLSTIVDATQDWDISYLDPSDNFLHSNSDYAYASDVHLPFYSSEVINNVMNSNSGINFKYEYQTNRTSSYQGGLTDFVTASYSINDASYSFIIPQSDITKVYTAEPTAVLETPDISYNLTGSTYSNENWYLQRVTRTSVFNASFAPKYGPFINIKLTINNITQSDVFYALKNRTSGKVVPISALKKYIASTVTSDLTTITETLSGNLVLMGTLNKNDLKPFIGVIQGESQSTGWRVISPEISVDTYYGFDNTYTLNDADIGGTVTTTTQYTNTSTKVILDLWNYYIPFTHDPDYTQYSIKSIISQNITSDTNFTSTLTNLKHTNGSSSYTFLDSNDNYNVIKPESWNSTNYAIVVTSDIHTTTITVKDNNMEAATIFIITLKNSIVYLGDLVVSSIPRDIWRSDIYLGNSSYDESFSTTDYTVGQEANILAVKNAPGVYLKKDTFNSTTITNGDRVSFRVLGDFVTVNSVGTADEPTIDNELGLSSYNSGSLAFQYRNVYSATITCYSAIFTLPWFRGYTNSTGQPQLYTIKRGSTVATFAVQGSNGLPTISQILTSNMSALTIGAPTSFTVNNLTDSATTYANLGIKGTFNYSMHPTGNILRYPVTVTGDSVTVEILNNNYAGGATDLVVPSDATPLLNPKHYSQTMTLKAFDQNNLYTFSGSYLERTRKMAIRPSRVKLHNTAFSYDKLQYIIKYESTPVTVYKALQTASPTSIKNNYLGNPTTHGAQDANAVPNASLWEIFHTLPSYEIKLQGINVGAKHIAQRNDKREKSGISYFVSSAPYLQFSTVSIENETGLPFNFIFEDSSYNRYMAYTGQTKFNPFKSSYNVTDISNNVLTIENDANYINDITFTYISSPTLFSMFLNPDTKKYKVIVPGIYLSINLYRNTNDVMFNIYNGPITSITTNADVSSTSIILKNRETNGSIIFSVLQLPTHVGYPANTVEWYSAILNTSTVSEFYNIDFNIGNPSWTNKQLCSFVANPVGVKATLYTVVDIYNPIAKRNTKRVYKYISDTSILINRQTTNLIFMGGRKYYDTLVRNNVDSSNSFSLDPSYITDYKTNLNNPISFNAGPVEWVNDTSYDTDKFTYINWAFGNSYTSSNVCYKLFSNQNNQQKWVFIEMLPFYEFKNQFGNVVSKIEWDGSITTPTVFTNFLSLTPSLGNPLLEPDNNTTVQQYSESSQSPNLLNIIG